MRVISGSARGRKLKRVPGDTTRPMMDRAKESLFNILRQELPGSRWLDLFAGTGQVGIEALSWGAAEVVFVDNHRAAVLTVKENLAHTRLGKGADVWQQDAFVYLERGDLRPFDFIYVAPPQYLGIWERVLQRVDERPLTFLTPVGVVVVQIDPKEFKELPLTHLVCEDRRKYGNTLLCFYQLLSNVI